jgi:hypothetical protein
MVRCVFTNDNFQMETLPGPEGDAAAATAGGGQAGAQPAAAAPAPAGGEVAAP